MTLYGQSTLDSTTLNNLMLWVAMYLLIRSLRFKIFYLGDWIVVNINLEKDGAYHQGSKQNMIQLLDMYIDRCIILLKFFFIKNLKII